MKIEQLIEKLQEKQKNMPGCDVMVAEIAIRNKQTYSHDILKVERDADKAVIIW